MGLYDEIDGFMANQDRIRSIMAMDSSGALNEMAKNADFVDDGTAMNLDGLKGKYAGSNTVKEINETTMANSKLPKEILQSFKENNIDIGGSSVLDEYVEKMPARPKPQRKVVTEQSVPQQPQGNGSVDYSMIRMIVEETIRKYTSSLKKSLVTEGVGQQGGTSLKAMKLGDKFSFIDDEGNLYEAKLTFVKNLNEDKKRG